MSNVESNIDDQSLTVEQAIANLKQTDDPSLRYYAAWWIGRFRVKETEAIEALLEALKDTSDRAPDGGYPLRRNAAKALGKLEDLTVIPALIECLECEDYYVREAAAQALAKLGDISSISPLLKLLEGGVDAAIQVTGKPHLNQPYEAIIEALGTLKAVQAIAIIEPFLNHTVAKVQYATARAMYQLTGKSEYGEFLVQALQGSELQLRRSALMDLGAIGYVKSAEAISKTFAENSLKLIALKGLLETSLGDHSNSLELSSESIEIMNLMDSLL
jgi:phycocyanobilin lyase subunit alpha